MSAIDVLIIVAILASCVLGTVRGFVREIVSLVAWVLGFWLAWKMGPLLEPHLGGVLAHEAVRPWVARLIVLLAVVLLGAVVGMVLNHFVRSTMLSFVDRVIGFMFGLVRGTILVGLAVIACQLLELDQSPWWHESKLVPYGETIGGWLRGLVNEHMR